MLASIFGTASRIAFICAICSFVKSFTSVNLNLLNSSNVNPCCFNTSPKFLFAKLEFVVSSNTSPIFLTSASLSVFDPISIPSAFLNNNLFPEILTVIPAARLSIIVIGTGQSKVSPSAPTPQAAVFPAKSIRAVFPNALSPSFNPISENFVAAMAPPSVTKSTTAKTTLSPRSMSVRSSPVIKSSPVHASMIGLTIVISNTDETKFKNGLLLSWVNSPCL